MRLALGASLLMAAMGVSAGQAQPISDSDPVWAQATDYLCRSDDNGHLERNADTIIRDIGVSTVDDAADRGNPTALFLRGFGEYRRLGGFVRRSGIGDDDLRRSARANHPLGAVWYATDHVNPNKQSEVISWLKRGAQQDCPFAELVYAVALSANPEPRLRDESHRKGLLILEELASGGYASAQLVLSSFLRSGTNGARIDLPRALKLLTAAADNGHPAAMSELAYSYLDGKGVAKNPGKAIEILLKIAEVGDPNRYAEVGELYLAGKDIARDLGKAQQYFDLAAKNGVTVKAEKLAELRTLQSQASAARSTPLASASRQTPSTANQNSARYIHLDCEGDEETAFGDDEYPAIRRYIIDLQRQKVTRYLPKQSPGLICSEGRTCSRIFGESIINMEGRENDYSQTFEFNKASRSVREVWSSWFSLTTFTAPCSVEYTSSPVFSKNAANGVTWPTLTNEIEFKERIRTLVPTRVANSRDQSAGGSVKLTANINADGVMTNCTFSGNSTLHDVGCKYLRRYARFKPASDRSGKAVASDYVGIMIFSRDGVEWDTEAW